MSLETAKPVASGTKRLPDIDAAAPCSIRTVFHAPLDKNERMVLLSDGDAVALLDRYFAEANDAHIVVYAAALRVYYIDNSGALVEVRDRTETISDVLTMHGGFSRQLRGVTAAAIEDSATAAAKLGADLICGGGPIRRQ